MRLTETLELLCSARHDASESEKILSRQRKLIDSLERVGYDLTEEVLLLEQLEEMQNRYIEHRERLEGQVLRFLRPEADSDEPDEDV